MGKKDDSNAEPKREYFIPSSGQGSVEATSAEEAVMMMNKATEADEAEDA